jgi:hypothetical protein
VRHLLSRLGFRVGAVLVIVLVVGIAVAAGRTIGHTDRPPTAINGASTDERFTTTSATPGSSDDGVQTPAPTLSATPADLQARVDQFMAAWLKRSASPGVWHSTIANLSTMRLAASLAGVDPLTVPATRVVASPKFPVLTATFAQAVIEVDSGTVTLTLLKQDGAWLVDGIDWSRT